MEQWVTMYIVSREAQVSRATISFASQHNYIWLLILFVTKLSKRCHILWLILSAFGTTSTSADLLNSKCASCSVAQDKSAYWTPAVYFMYSDGSAEVVPEKPPHKS